MKVQGHPRSKVMVSIDSPWATSCSTSIDPSIISVTILEICDGQFQVIQGHGANR